MYLNISRSLNYSQADIEKSRKLAHKLDSLDLSEFPKAVVESRNKREEAWELMEEVRKYQHFVPPIMPDPQAFYSQELQKKQVELRTLIYEVNKPLIEHAKKMGETKEELFAITRPIVRQVYDLLTDSVKRLPEFERTRQIRTEKEFRELAGPGDAMGDVKVSAFESNREVIGKIQDILLEARDKFTGDGCEMMTCSIEKIIHALEVLENRIERIDIAKAREQTVGQVAVQDVKERAEKK